MGLTISREFGFDTAHRVLHHEGKCASLHGHRYTAIVEVSAHQLDALGRIIDFSEMKTIVNTWLDVNWDHSTILHCDDPLLKTVMPSKRSEVFGPRGVFIADFNPTVENIVVYLFHELEELFAEVKIELISIKLYETPNCSAYYSKTSK